jgi:hypothetical protein
MPPELRACTETSPDSEFALAVAERMPLVSFLGPPRWHRRGGETTMMIRHMNDPIRTEVAVLGAPFGVC